MLSAIKAIGEIIKNESKEIRPKENAKVLSILINTDQNKYEGIDIEDFDSTKEDFYLFSEGSSRGNVPYPFCPLTEPPKTLKKISGWLKGCQKYAATNRTDEIFLNKATKLFDNNKKNMIKDLSGKASELPKKITRYLTAKINGQFLGEYPFFRTCLQQIENEKRKSSSNIGTCSICASQNKEVSGKTDVFKFYTIDKPGFIAGGFNKKTAWKNFPVCDDCYIELKIGRKYLENNLRFNFYGFNYLLIPSLLISDRKNLKDLLDILSNTKKEISLKQRSIKKITADEEEILEFLAEQGDQVTVNFLFLQQSQSAERIIMAIEDVFPSRIRKIFEAKKAIDKLFQNDQKKDFTFATIRTFFSKSDENKKRADLDKYFLDVVYSVFKGTEISFSFLTKFLLPVIRNELPKEDSNLYSRIRDAMMTLSFLEKLEIIKFREENVMDNSPFDAIFNRYSNSFFSPSRRGIFLVGALTQLLLNKQYANRGAKPFIRKLKSLKMNENDIRALLPQVINKLEEYDAFDSGKQKIASAASRYLLEAGEGWKMSVDEINFYFVCGMNLTNEISDIIYNNI